MIDSLCERAKFPSYPPKIAMPQKSHQTFSCSPDPNATVLASCGRGKDVLLWDVATGKKKSILSFDRPFVLAVAFSRDGKTIAAFGYDDEVSPNSNWVLQLWDASTLKPIRRIAGKEKEPFHNARLSRDGSVLAVQKKDGTLDLWDTVAGRQTGSIKSRGADWTGHFDLTGNGLTVLTLSVREKDKGKYEGHLELWDSQSGKNTASKELSSEQIERDEFGRLVLAPDGKTAAFQIDESKVALWRGAALLKELPVRQPNK